MNCPKCQGQLVSQIFKDQFQYEVCVKCEGRWIGGATLHNFCDSFWHCGEKKTFEHFMAQPRKTTKIPCPSCTNKNLTLVISNEIEVEFCLGCNGAFFDIGEMIKAMPKGKYDLTQMGNSSLNHARKLGFDIALGSIISSVIN